MPIRSSGCAVCRKRKIRCDEGRPGCKRCATHGVECPGYRTDKPGGIEFKDQTRITVRRANEQYKTKSQSQTSTWRVGLRAESSDQSSSSVSSDEVHTPVSFSSTDPLIVADEGFTKNQPLGLAIPYPTYNGGRVIGPVPLLSPNTERARIYNEFVTSYLPVTQRGAQNGHFSFFQTIALKQSEQPALQQSLDALSLVQIGSIYKDKSLLKQAVDRYGKALNSLARSIYKGQYLYDDDVLAAVTVLATCELYREIQDMGEGWQKHVQGADQLVAARGPDSIQSDLALLLYSNMRHGSLLHALISRKAPFLATPEWRKVAFRVPKAVYDDSTIFYDMAIQVPGLLERHDELDLDLPNVLRDIDRILEDSRSLESALRDWFVDWQSRATADGKEVCEIRPIDDFRTFTSLCPDRTFDHGYSFPDFMVAYLHSLYWMVMHYLRTNTQMLHKHRHQLVPDWYPSPNTIVQEDELLNYILNLCQCMPFFVEPKCSSTGSIGIFLPMRCAAMYFSQHGHWDWLRWIGNVKSSVFVRGLAPPTVKHRSGKVSPGP